MKKLFYIVGYLLVLSSSPVLAQSEPEIAVVRIDLGARRLVITRGEGNSEIKKLSVRAIGEKSLVDVNEIYYTTVKQLYQEGYVLQQRLNASESVSILFFLKAPKP